MVVVAEVMVKAVVGAVEAVVGAVEAVVASVQEQGMMRGPAFKHLGGLPWRPCRQ